MEIKPNVSPKSSRESCLHLCIDSDKFFPGEVFGAELIDLNLAAYLLQKAAIKSNRSKLLLRVLSENICRIYGLFKILSRMTS